MKLRRFFFLLFALSVIGVVVSAIPFLTALEVNISKDPEIVNVSARWAVAITIFCILGMFSSAMYAWQTDRLEKRKQRRRGLRQAYFQESAAIEVAKSFSLSARGFERYQRNLRDEWARDDVALR